MGVEASHLQKQKQENRVAKKVSAKSKKAKAKTNAIKKVSPSYLCGVYF